MIFTQIPEVNSPTDYELAIVRAKLSGYTGLRCKFSVPSMCWNDAQKTWGLIQKQRAIARACFQNGMRLMFQIDGGYPVAPGEMDWWPEDQYRRMVVLDAMQRAICAVRAEAVKANFPLSSVYVQPLHEEANGGKKWKVTSVAEGTWTDVQNEWANQVSTLWYGGMKVIGGGFEAEYLSKEIETYRGPLNFTHWGCQMYLSRLNDETDDSYKARLRTEAQNRVNALRTIKRVPVWFIEHSEYGGVLAKETAAMLDGISYVEGVNTYCLDGWG